MPILWMAVLAETSGILYYDLVYPNNHWIFNLYSFLYYIVFYSMIYGFVQNKKRQHIIIALSGVVLLAYIANSIYTDPIHQPLTYADTIATIVMVLHLMYAAIEVLKSNTVFTIRNSLPFFIFSGYILIEIALIPIGVIRNADIHLWPIEVYRAVNKVLGVVIIIANCYFIFGFLWTRSRRGTILDTP
jgi:hypothetical protein